MLWIFAFLLKSRRVQSVLTSPCFLMLDKRRSHYTFKTFGSKKSIVKSFEIHISIFYHMDFPQWSYFFMLWKYNLIYVVTSYRISAVLIALSSVNAAKSKRSDTRQLINKKNKIAAVYLSHLGLIKLKIVYDLPLSIRDLSRASTLQNAIMV